MTEYEVHLHPPAYPEKCRPSLCRHEPQFVMQHDVHIVTTKGKNHIEIDHSVCLACGLSRPCTVGGNVLVDLIMLLERFGFHAEIGGRIAHLRNKWSRIATHLFDESGWNGRHKRVAKLIDPKLTMKLFLEPINHPAAIAAGHKMGRITFDRSCLRDPDRYTVGQDDLDLEAPISLTPIEHAEPAELKPGSWAYALECRDIADVLRSCAPGPVGQIVVPLLEGQRDLLTELLMREFKTIEDRKQAGFEGETP